MATLTQIKTLIKKCATTLPVEIQKIILYYAYTHPCSVLIKNSDVSLKELKWWQHSFWRHAPFWHSWSTNNSMSTSALYNNFIYTGSSSIYHGSSITPRIRSIIPSSFIPEEPLSKKEKNKIMLTKNRQQNNRINSHKKQQYRSQKQNNRATKRRV